MTVMPTETLAAPDQNHITAVHLEINRALDGLDVRFSGLDEAGKRLRFARVSGVSKERGLDALASGIIRRLFEAQEKSSAIKTFLQGKTEIEIV